nr:histidine phosphatase family protein [Pseudomonas sp. PCH199]
MVAVIGVLLITALVTGFVLWPRSPISLVNAQPSVRAQMFQGWEAGEMVVLVRHAERCDRSTHPCLGPADGITRAGSDSAQAVGQGLVSLGMTQADVLSSPLTRTAQTAHYMFGKDAQTQEWLADCGSTWRNDIVAHKRAHRNLVLVTHSGCISDFEAMNGFNHAPKSEYGSSLFVHVDKNGQLQVLGIVKAEDWSSLPYK